MRHKEISKLETTHPEAALLVAGDFNAGITGNIRTELKGRTAAFKVRDSNPEA
jgi:hypothetical protein